MRKLLTALALLLVTTPAVAQQRYELERFRLAVNNTPSAPAKLYGGRYVLTQSCASYGTGSLTIRYLDADGVTMRPLTAAKLAADATTLDIMAGQVVDVTVPSDGAGCFATIGRAPQ